MAVSGVAGGGLPSEGGECLPTGVSTQGGVCLGGCLPRGYLTGGCLPGGGGWQVPRGRHPSVDKMKDACENITFPQLLLRTLTSGEMLLLFTAINFPFDERNNCFPC